MRKLKPHRGYQATNMNPLWHIYRLVKFPKVLRQTIIIEICRYMPNLKLKSHMYRQLLGMDIGNYSVFAFKVVPDLFYPELITVGNNSVIGYNTTILTHEILVDEFKHWKGNDWQSYINWCQCHYTFRCHYWRSCKNWCRNSCI